MFKTQNCVSNSWLWNSENFELKSALIMSLCLIAIEYIYIQYCKQSGVISTQYSIHRITNRSVMKT